MYQDIKYGARLLWRSPWFTLVAVASLALGLGTGVALFTVMNAVLFRPLPGQGTADIQVIHTSNSDGTPGSSSSFADFQSFRRTDQRIFAGDCAAARVTANVDSESTSFALPGAVMSGGCFDLLKLRPHPGMGRVLNRSDELPTGQSPAIVISFSLWRRGFGGVMTHALHASFTGLAPLDPTVVVPAVLMLGAVLMTAAWFPARRAARVEPAAALRG